MSKRYVEECDLCKKEAELENSLSIKPNKSKKAGRTYDLCDACKELLEKALVSREGLAVLGASVPRPQARASGNSAPKGDDPNTITLDDGSTRPIPTRDDIAKGNEDDAGAFDAEPVPEGTHEETGEPCLHMNRYPPRVFTDTSKVQTECRDCGARLPYRSARMKERELNVKGHAGVKLSNHPSEERKGR